MLERSMTPDCKRMQVIDSHTGGEPTRVVIDGGPDLPSGTMAQLRARLEAEHDWLRSAVVNEPRGSDAVVGALLCPPSDPSCEAGVIFFNNTGYINMCVHGTIGLAVTLAWLGRLDAQKKVRIETPVGVVGATLHQDGSVTVANVPSYRTHVDLSLRVAGFGDVVADIAWGGNWFLLVHEHDLEVSYANIPRLMAFGSAAREALQRESIQGVDGMEIDHVEIFAPAEGVAADSRNFVLCPGGAYDRSPCGTGTSAKLACLYAAGKLKEGEVWRQAGIVGSVFQGYVKLDEKGRLIPHITGEAYVNGESTLIFNSNDPFRHGITRRTIS